MSTSKEKAMAGQNTSGAPATAEHSAPKRKPKSLMVQRISYAFGNLGQAAYYNALSTYFVTYYAAQTLFSRNVIMPIIAAASSFS